MIKVIFKKGAPSGFLGYGAIETVGEKQLENFQKTGMYEIEVIGEHTIKPDPSPKRARDKGKFVADDPSTPDVNEAWEGGKAPENTPDNDWTVGEIKTYLNDNNIEFTGTHNTKAKLLALVDA